MSIISKCRSGISLIFVGVMFLSVCSEAYARDVRGYITPPDGTAGVLFYSYQRSADKKYVDGDKVDADFNMNLQIVRPVYYKEICHYMTSVQMLFPFGSARVHSGANQFNASGLADPTLLLGFWPIANKDEQMWFAIAEYITAPLGAYENDRPLNMGANRWAFKTESSFVKGFGKLFIDITPKVEFYTNNTDYFYGGTSGNTLSTTPLYSLESHLSYDFTDKFLLSLDYYYDGGATNKVNGNKYDRKDNHSVQITAGINLAPQHKLLLQYMEVVKAKNGYKTNQVGIRYFYIF